MLEWVHMEIKYLGEKAVFLKGKKESVLVNPDDGFNGKSGTRIILYTNENGGRATLEENRVFINGEGEYEVGGVEVSGVDGEDGNTVYRLVIDGFKVVIVGELKQELSEKKLSKIDETDILIVSLMKEEALGYKVFNSWAKEWGANYLIPLSEDKKVIDEFLDKSDDEGLEASESLKVEKAEDLPDGLEIKLLKVAK